MNKKIILAMVGILVLVLGIGASVLGLRYFRRPRAGASPENEPQQVRLAEVAPQSATIAWVTANPAYGFISYGETMSLGRTSQEAEKTTGHSVTLTNLTPQTSYYYKIGVGEELFDDAGIPYSFTTPSEQPPTEEAPSAPGGPSPFGPSATEEPALEGFETALGTANPLYDLNGDGEVNALDVSLFAAQKEASPSASAQ